MTNQQRHLELINADIDGEITADEKRELDEILANDADARALHGELRSTCDSLNAGDMLEVPPGLRTSIMGSLPASGGKSASAPESSRSLLRSLFEAPALRYAASFAAGIALAVILIDSSQLSGMDFDDITQVVGTIADPSVQPSPAVTQRIDEPEVTGQLSLSRSGPLMIVDIDVTTDGPVDIVASYRSPAVWFHGFAQLESEGTQISTTNGEVRITADGQRRYALYLHNRTGRNTAVRVTFVVDGAPVHETTIDYPPG